MRSILVDTGIFIALFDGNDVMHQRAVAFAKHKDAEFITTVPVVGEVMAMLAFSVDTQIEFLEWLTKSVTLDADIHLDLDRIAVVMKKYADLPADFADASLVALAERRDIMNVASYDSDFVVYRTKVKRKFKILA